MFREEFEGANSSQKLNPFLGRIGCSVHVLVNKLFALPFTFWSCLGLKEKKLINSCFRGINLVIQFNEVRVYSMVLHMVK